MAAQASVLTEARPAPQRSRARRFFDATSGGFWIGWKIESNWTDAFKFMTYQIARPIGGALILVFMYYAVAGGRRGAVLGFFVVGTAFWPLVLGGVQSTVRGVLEDREAFRTVKYIYTAPIPYPAYMLGRALAGLAAMGSAAVAVTLAVGDLFLGVGIHYSPGSIGLVVLATAIGIIGILALGIISVAAAFSTTHEAWQMPEALSAALYLICGAIFPLTVLPAALRAVGAMFPLTWWLEAVRRALLEPAAPRSFPWASDGYVYAMLVVTSIGATVVAALVFTAAERRARKLGTLDLETSF
jgi:ABC-2 type transport system permease protein